MRHNYNTRSGASPEEGPKLDIFPRADDPGSMEDRRAVLHKALKVAGLAFASPFLGAATPYVRLPGDQGDTTDERRRFAYEVAAVNAQLLNQPAVQTQPALLALWANLDQFRRTATENVFDLRAWTAILGSVNAVTLNDQQAATAWLTLAHRYARLAEDRNLVSLAHSKAANAGMYFGVSPRHLIADANLAMRYGTTSERKGMGHAMFARAIALAGEPGIAIQAGEKALALAEDVAGSPRTDGWVKGQAHMTISRALAGFPHLRSAVEQHVEAALSAEPERGSLWRAQPLLNVAEVRAHADAIDGAADVLVQVLDQLTPQGAQPSLVRRIIEITRTAEARHPGTSAMGPVRERLEYLANA